ncbi:MAG: hypothetical protein AAFZ07_20835 [Actinomycetota bacterium]
MLIGCWSPKGGSGTSVVAAALGLSGPPALLVDLAGELDGVLGVAAEGPGVGAWLGAATVPPPDALGRLEMPVATGVGLLAWGDGGPADGPGHVALLADLLRTDGRLVVVDAGSTVSETGQELLRAAELRLCVVRPCYLALRRLQRLTMPADGIVLVDEPGRALRADDVAAAAGVPVIARVPWDPAISRAVDAGVLASRQPRPLLRSLRSVHSMRMAQR